MESTYGWSGRTKKNKYEIYVGAVWVALCLLVVASVISIYMMVGLYLISIVPAWIILGKKFPDNTSV